MKQFLRKAAITVLFLIAMLAVLLIALHIEEGYRGARKWAETQRALRIRGETLDLRQLIPPGRPKDDLSTVPIFSELYQQYYKWLQNRGRGAVYPGMGKSGARIYRVDVHLGSIDYSVFPNSASYLRGETIDMAAWQKAYRIIPESHLSGPPGKPAQDVLKALSQLDPEMNEIETALDNPDAYWPINYEVPCNSYLGATMELLRVARVIQLRGVAHLDNDEIDLAEKDYLFSFRLNRSLLDGTLVDYLLAHADRTEDDAILWEGLHRHAWNIAQLEEMEAALAATDPLDDGRTTFQSERASSLQSIKAMQMDDPRLGLMSGNVDAMMRAFRIFNYVRPVGWWDQDRADYCLGIENFIVAIKPSMGRVDPEPFDHQRNREGNESLWNMFYVPLTTSALPALAGAGEKIAETESYRRLARLACRLEVYKLHHQHYPDELDQLPDLPPHLTEEVLTGKPIHYWRKEDGYVLYSTSWDQKDHGGLPYKTPRALAYDWLWPSP